MTLEELNNLIERANRKKKEPEIDKGKSEALRSTGRPFDTPQAKVRTAGDILAGDKALQELLKLRDSL